MHTENHQRPPAMRRKIPSTNALMAFEAAARHESYTRAAEELALTQSAICRQIGSLESTLGTALFRRTRRGVQLTEAGQSYYRHITPLLDALAQSTLNLMAQKGAGAALELAVVPTFATRWLLPRLGQFQRLHPEIQVHMHVQTRPFLFEQGDVHSPLDAAIYCGNAGWPGTVAHFLMHEYPVPVCSPKLVAGLTEAGEGHGASKSEGEGGDEIGGATLPPHAITTLPLLQQSTRPYAWRQWFEAQGLRAEGDMAGTRLELFSMLAQAASQGMGVALIPPFLIQQELAAGALIVLNPRPLCSERAYWLIVPERKAAHPALTALSQWLQAQARADAA